MNQIFITALLSLSIFSTLVRAEEVVKVLDGTSTYCPILKNSLQIAADKVVLSSIDGDDLLIQVVTCNKGQWTQDQNLATHKVQFNGITIIEKYSEFELVLQAVDENFFPIKDQYRTIHLVNFQTHPVVRIPLTDIKSIGQLVDINLSSLKSIQASNGYQSAQKVQWGSHRIRF